MVFKTFLLRKNIKVQKLKVITKLWKVQIVLPCIVTFYEKDENEKKMVWTIKQVLN